jgi:hypothetical protein
VVAILMDITNYPGNPTQFTVNTNHVKNPQQTQFLNAKMVSVNTAGAGTNLPGVGTDLVYRDPWGNPYVITMVLNYDEMWNDSFYGLASISQAAPNSPTGLYGLYNNVDPANSIGNHFQFHGKVMVWSVGPKVGASQGVDTSPNAKANTGANRNHVISWQ